MNSSNENNTKPIKRHETIAQFSREHHFGLLLVWKIKQGIKKSISPERISNYVLYFYEQDLKQHFSNEEKILFVHLPEASPLRIQAMQEHEKIYSLIEMIKNEKNSYPLLTRFSEMLDNHIRFEERTLFSHIQEVVPEKNLLEYQVNHIDNKQVDNDWDDHFWETKN